MSNKNFENNNNTEAVNANPTNSLIYKFEHGERLKAEQEAKERKRALFAKKMAKFGEGEKDDLPKSTNAVNQKAKMFIEIANKDPEKERAERERKLEFERKKMGFQEGTVPCNNNTKVKILEFMFLITVNLTIKPLQISQLDIPVILILCM